MTDAIVFSEVSFAYGPDAPEVLRRTSLSIPEGAFVLVTGATGAGKSTFLRCINGLVPHFSGGVWSGEVAVAGSSTIEHAPRGLAAQVAYVSQDPDASFVLDRVEDELAYAMENLAVPPHAMRRRVEETLDLLALAPLRDRSVRSLSGGERQRVAIASALTAGARILVLDEPTSQLDPQGAEDVLAALKRLVDDLAFTVIVAEHRLERVTAFADLAVGAFSSGRFEIGDVAGIVEQLGGGPPVTRLGRRLGWTPLPLTVREARARVGRVNGVTGSREVEIARHFGSPVVAMTGVSARYARDEVLHDVTLTIDERVTALIGRNGAGKTTLLRCLAGLHDPASGRIAMASSGASPRTGTDVAFSPQDPGDILYAETVAAEVAATLDARGASTEELDKWLDAAGLESKRDIHPRDLSAGERSLLAIVAIAATAARILALDEPTRGLDPESKDRLCELLDTMAREGHAIVVATHDVELVAEMADHVVMLAAGEVVAQGPPRAILSGSPVFSPQMARISDGRWLTLDEATTALGSS
ncbi:MAG TPA: ATP-binding cassette domain-containing protein [Actinomycetota bacterium]|nr:ATP-binding cassette domain-containing protein [Actinomycetota bacterium]